MGRYLIVANQTLGGEELDRAVRNRIELGDSQFYIVVPMTVLKQETAFWTRGFPVGEEPGLSAAARKRIAEDERRRERVLDESRRRAERRLDQMIDSIRSAGGEVDGAVGDADPAVAVKDVLADRSFDEVIISTLPTGVSRWLKMDLPNRVSRMTDAPVTKIVAKD